MGRMASSPSPGGIFRLNTMMVIRIAITPSLNASRRALPMILRSAPGASSGRLRLAVVGTAALSRLVVRVIVVLLGPRDAPQALRALALDRGAGQPLALRRRPRLVSGVVGARGHRGQRERSRCGGGT